ncbi:MAG: hypothetical protein H6735_25290 [Alphaproteobacteria bacterium]|nr:hypothetical protein [Alphaproteobacteria bacterium]
MSFFTALWARPPELTALSRYTIACGVFYLLTGLLLFAGAGPIASVVAAVEGYAITDLGLMRIAGMAVAIIGWFYILGGRSGATSFALATVVDRYAVPLFLVPVWWLGEAPASLALSFAVLDPVLATVALVLWLRQPR